MFPSESEEVWRLSREVGEVVVRARKLERAIKMGVVYMVVCV